MSNIVGTERCQGAAANHRLAKASSERRRMVKVLHSAWWLGSGGGFVNTLSFRGCKNRMFTRC
jgi:hypothetical protein